MKKKYIVDGKIFEIPDSESGAFLKDFPTAKVSYNVEGKEYQIPHQEANDFEIDMGLKKKPSSNAAATPSEPISTGLANGSSVTPIVKEPVQKRMSLEDFGIKAPSIPKSQQVNQPVSTEAVQPKVTATYDDFVAHNDEHKAKKAKLINEAIDNTARKVLKNKGIIKPEQDGKALNLSEYIQVTKEKKRLQEAFDNGDVTFGISKDGEVGLNKTIGWWDSLSKGWKQAMQGNDEAAAFTGMDATQKVDFLKKKEAEQPVNENPEYIGERPSNLGSLGKLTGETGPFLVKAAEGGALGAGLILAAPETLGASLVGLPAATAFIFTANDSKNQGIQQEVTRRFYKLKQQFPNTDEVDLMKQAEQGALAGGLAGIATNAALMTGIQTPLSLTAQKVVGKAVTKAIGSSVYGGAATATIEGLKLAEGNLEGIKATPTEIAKEMGKNFVETTTTLGLLHVMTGAVTGAFSLPKTVRSAIKYALKDTPPQEISTTLKANEEAGTIPKGTTEQVMAEMGAYHNALGKVIDGLSPEAEASVAGLIESKNKLIEEQKTKDDSEATKAYYKEKIDGINEQIDKTINTGKPYAHEVNEMSGEKYTSTKGEPENISKPIELNPNVTEPTGAVNEPLSTETKQPKGQSNTGEVPASVEPNSSGGSEATAPVLDELSKAKELVNSGVVKGFTADVLKDAANNNEVEFKSHLKDIAEQAQDPRSEKVTVATYGQELVDEANKLFPTYEETKSTEVVKPTKETSVADESVSPVSKPTEKTEGVAANQEVISITHEVTDAVAKELGLPEYEEKPETRAEWDTEVDKRLSENPNAIPEMLAKYRSKGKIDKYDQRMMLKYHASLKARINENPTPELIKQYNEAKVLSDIEGGREVAKSLVARQGTAPVEDSLANYLVAEAESHGVETLPQEAINELKAKYEADQKVIADLNARITKLEEDAANKKLAEEVNKQNKTKTSTKKTADDFKKERSEIKDSIKDKLRKARGETSAVIIPYAKELIAISPDVLKLVKSYVEEGVTDLAEIVKKAHEELKIHIPEIEERDIRDIIKGDYTQKKQTRNDIAAQMRELRSQQKLADKLESLQKGEKQIKDPIKKQKANQEIESLKEQIKDFDRKTPEESALQSLKTGLKNKIEKLKKDLETGDFLKEPEPKKPIKLDAEAQALKDEHIRFVKETNIRRAKAEFENRGKGEKIYDGVMQVLSIKRIVQTAVDLSIPFRQGVTLAFNPRRWQTFGKGFGAMMQSVFSTKKFDSLMYDIHKSADYQDMLKDKVVFNEMDAVDSNSRNEDFQKSFVYKIPLIREPLLASNRAADGFLNVSRYEMYMKGKKMLERQGITRENSPENYEALGKWVMNITGRGNLLKFLEDSHNGRVVSSNTFFGARLMASRFNMLNPLYYMKMPKEVRIEALKDVATFTGMIASTLLAASAAGATVNTDIDNPDFLKIKVGNIKYDITGGLVQYIRTYLRLNRAVSQRLFDRTMSKKEKDKYAAYAVGSTFNFFKYKLAPNTSYGLSALTGKDPLGQPFDPTDALKIYPMYIDDMVTAYKDGGLTSFVTVGLPSILGVGVQSYPDKGTKFNDPVTQFIKDKKLHIADATDKYKDADEEKVMTETEFESYKANRQKRIEHDLLTLKKNGLVSGKKDDESIQKAVTRIVTRAGEDAKAEVIKKSNKPSEPNYIKNDRPLPVRPVH